MTDSACTAFSPIYIHCGDTLTKNTADEILAHDKLGAKLCGWKPKHATCQPPAIAKPKQ